MAENDIVVIGGGTGGFMAALRAAQLGGKVLVVEKDKIGGICPNWGCIPTCYMIRCAEMLKQLKLVKEDGISVGRVKIDYPRMISEKNKIANMVCTGMEMDMKAFGVKIVQGVAKITGPGQVEVKYSSGEKKIHNAKQIVIAAGSLPRRYDVPGAYGDKILTAKELLDLQEIPKSLVIIGRSTIALELATVWASLGTRVTMIARKPELMPGEDKEVAAHLAQIIKDCGVRVYSGDIVCIEDHPRGKTVTFSTNGKKRKVTAQYAVFSLGHNPCITDLGLENAGVAVSEGRIKTNARMETNVKDIYAVGDITGEYMLANIALVQGYVTGENIMGKDSTIDYRLVPRFVRTIPPMSAAGMTEEEAREKIGDVHVGKFPLALLPKTRILREYGGFVKIIAHPDSGEILGVHIVGPEAIELIHEALVIMKSRGTIQDLAGIIHNHPCLQEAVWRAAQDMCA